MRTLYWAAHLGCWAMAATTRSGTAVFARTLSTWLSVRNGIVQGDFDGLRMAFRQKRPSDARGAAARQRQFLAHRKLGHAGDDDFFGGALDVGRGGRQQAQAHEIEKVELPDDGDGDALRCARMGGETESHAFAGNPFILRGNRAQHICGQVQPVEKNRDVRLFAVRIFEDGEQDFFAGLVGEGF